MLIWGIAKVITWTRIEVFGIKYIHCKTEEQQRSGMTEEMLGGVWW